MRRERVIDSRYEGKFVPLFMHYNIQHSDRTQRLSDWRKFKLITNRVMNHNCYRILGDSREIITQSNQFPCDTDPPVVMGGFKFQLPPRTEIFFFFFFLIFGTLKCIQCIEM